MNRDRPPGLTGNSTAKSRADTPKLFVCSSWGTPNMDQQNTHHSTNQSAEDGAISSSTASTVVVKAEPYSTISVVAISDSHSMHSALQYDWPTADIFVHAGDLTQYGTKEELQSAIAWLGSLPFMHKIVIAGNHDIGLDKTCTYRSALARRAGTYATPEEIDALIATMRQNNIVYLSPEEPSVKLFVRECCVEIYGLPFSPLSIGPSAFMRPRTEDTWAQVGGGHYDILLSHAPPRGHLDQNRRGDHVGCDHFFAAIERIKPTVVVFGHIHEARGSDTLTWADGTTTALYNVAIMNKDQTLSPLTKFDMTLRKHSMTATRA